MATPNSHTAPSTDCKLSKPVVLFFIFLTAYLFIHFLVRLSISSTFNHDAGEQATLTRSLSWGYYEQPPLYTWVVWVFFKVFGLSVATTTFLRFAILGGIYVFVFLIARIVLKHDKLAILASLSLILMPIFSWEFVRDLTHTPLACLLSAASFYVVLRVIRRDTLLNYVLLGVLIGLGVLCKYNFAVYAVALMIAGLTTSSGRRRIFDFRIVLTLAVAMLLVTPHFFWLAHNYDRVRSALAMKTVVTDSFPLWKTIGLGTTSLISNLGMLAGGVWLTYLLLLPGSISFSQKQEAVDSDKRLLRNLLIAVVLVLMATNAWTRLTTYAVHWLAPLFLLVPICHLGKLDWQRIQTWRWRALGGVAAACALAGIIAHASFFAKYHPKDKFFEHLCHTVKGERSFGDLTIVTDNALIAGNLRLLLADDVGIICTRFDAPEMTHQVDGDVLIIWHASQYKTPHPNLLRFLERIGYDQPLPSQLAFYKVYTDRPWHMHHFGLARAAKETESARLQP